jgi:hypothetical protein
VPSGRRPTHSHPSPKARSSPSALPREGAVFSFTSQIVIPHSTLINRHSKNSPHPDHFASDLLKEVSATFKERLCHDLRKRITLPPGGSRGTSGEGEHVTARKFDV